MAEMERDQLRERTRAGLAAARDRGRMGGRRCTLTPGQIQIGRALVAAGDSMRQAAKKIGAESHVTLYRALRRTDKDKAAQATND